MDEVLRQVETNNRELQAVRQYYELQLLESKSENNLPDPSVSYSHQYGNRETGIISMASEGKLVRFLDVKTIEKTLISIYMDDFEDTSASATFKNFFRRKKDAE